MAVKRLSKMPKAMGSLLRFLWPRSGKIEPLAEFKGSALRVSGFQIDRNEYRHYQEVCELDTHNPLSILYPQVIVSPLQLALLSDKLFPLSMLGAVHRHNCIIQNSNIDLADTLDLCVTMFEYRVLAKGVEIELLNEVRVQDRLVWRSLSTFYVRGDFALAEHQAQMPQGMDDLGSLSKQEPEKWYLHPDRGWRYARITRDYNPIHISNLAAKAFGFDRDLAHGFFVLARCLEAAQGAETKAIYDYLTVTERSVELVVEFRGPNYFDKVMSVYFAHQHREEGADGCSNIRLDAFCAGNPRPTLCSEIHFNNSDGVSALKPNGPNPS